MDEGLRGHIVLNLWKEQATLVIYLLVSGTTTRDVQHKFQDTYHKEIVKWQLSLRKEVNTMKFDKKTDIRQYDSLKRTICCYGRPQWSCGRQRQDYYPLSFVSRRIQFSCNYGMQSNMKGYLICEISEANDKHPKPFKTQRKQILQAHNVQLNQFRELD